MGASPSKVAPAGLPVPAAKTPIPVARAVVRKMGKEEKTENTPDDNLDTKEIEPVKQNDFELAIRSCKELEFILETEFASTGTSLHEKITNCNTSLPIELIMNLRYVATIGNNLCHEKSFSSIPDQQEFIRRYQKCILALKEISKQRRSVEKRLEQAKQEKRKTEIQAKLMQEDKKWLEQQEREMEAEKQRKLEEKKAKEEAERVLAQEREREAEIQRELAAQNRMCACF